ncbi:MAG: hypothetical protein HY646_11680 [Acidobacteria bacterium]|nr:hypothetical protein [Acidobacteriota bacterium]
MISRSFSDRLAHVTGGRRYCFVVMTYHGRRRFFEWIRAVVSETAGLECIRADDIPGAGRELRDKIHYAIDNATLVVGEVSESRPNIYYEVGYALAKDKPLLALARENVIIHTDLLGMEVLRYDTQKKGWEKKLEQALRHQLMPVMESHVSLLRAMMIPNSPQPSYIMANPKRPPYRFQGLRSSYGDYLGFVRILGAFGSVFGEHVVPELLNPEATSDPFERWDGNLYLIASPKMNRATGMFMGLMQRKHRHPWRFIPYSEEVGMVEHHLERLAGRVARRSFVWLPRGRKFVEMCREDYGLILRGPHPFHRKRMVTIMAGTRSLGTGAACLAATSSDLIRQTAQKLEGKADLADRDRMIWVLVKGCAGGRNFFLNAKNVTIYAAGVCD